MPIITDTTLTTRKANAIMSGAFLPRAKKWLFPLVSQSYEATNFVEPHVIGGAAPSLRRFRGTVNSTGIPSWRLYCTTPLYKNKIQLDRSETEHDQTRTLLRKADEIGVAIADFPEQLWAAKLLKGDSASVGSESFEGTTYQTTMDGLAQFSASHQLNGVTSQSNIIQGSLPQTLEILQESDIALMANYMQRDLNKIVKAIKTVKNNQGLPIYPTLDLKENIVVVVPAALEVVAQRAFKSGLIGGSPGSNGSTGSSDSVAPMFVKDVLVSGYLDGGFPDPEVETGATVSPTYDTQWYVLIVSDRVKPFYFQNYVPPANSDLFPKGFNVDGMIDSALADAKKLGLEGTTARIAATTFASTLVEHNLTAVGANSQESVFDQEKFFVGARSRLGLAYGPWFTSWLVQPGSVSGGQ